MNTPLPASTPIFFFSYARKDDDKWLRRFLSDLKAAVQGLGMDDANFHDISNIEPGDDWEERIAAALQCSLTMVCLYTPWYFRRDYCGKEFQVFIERQTTIRMDEDGTVRGSEKIIPVLWQPLKALTRWGFPPAILRFIQHTIGNVPAEYEEDGLHNILKQHGRRGPYHRIVRIVAEQIVERAMNNPLSALREPPSLNGVRSAFVSAASTGVATSGTMTPGGPDALTAVYLAPSPRIAGPDQRSDASGSSGIAALVEEVAVDQSIHCFHHWISSDPTLAGKQTVGLLREANRLNRLALLVLDMAVATRDHVELLRHILPSHQWCGGLLIIGGEEEEDAWDLRSAVRTIVMNPARVLIKELAGRSGPVRAELAPFLSELRRRVLATGPVQQPLIREESPQRRPLLAGPREDLSDAVA